MQRRVANLLVCPKYFRWEFRPPGWDFPDHQRRVEEDDRVWDCDQCGDQVSFWVIMFDTPKFYEVKHAWWVEHDPEFEVLNEFQWREVGRDQLSDEAKSNLKFVV